MHLLKAHPDQIDWFHLSSNPAIFELNYSAIRRSIEPFKEDLVEQVYHPLRVARMLDQFKYCMAEDCFVDTDTDDDDALF